MNSFVGSICGVALLLTGLAMAGGGCATGSEITRTVVVRDAQGRPVQGAQIHIVGQGVVSRGMTGGDGTVRISTPATPLSLAVERQGYSPVQVSTRADERVVNVTIREDY